MYFLYVFNNAYTGVAEPPVRYVLSHPSGLIARYHLRLCRESRLIWGNTLWYSLEGQGLFLPNGWESRGCRCPMSSGTWINAALYNDLLVLRLQMAPHSGQVALANRTDGSLWSGILNKFIYV